MSETKMQQARRHLIECAKNFIDLQVQASQGQRGWESVREANWQLESAVRQIRVREAERG